MDDQASNNNNKRVIDSLFKMYTQEDVRNCKNCKKIFAKTRKGNVYCTDKCKNEYYWTMRHPRISKYKNISGGTVGAISELSVSIDLLQKRYEIFRSVSPNCSCDLIALKNGIFKRIEVRTSYKGIDGHKTRRKSKNDIGRQDLFAWVYEDEIVYEDTITGIQQEI